MNVQYLHDQVRATPNNLIRSSRERLTTLTIRRQFFYDTLGFEARWYRDVDNRDDLARLTINYQLTDATLLALSVDHFSGVDTGAFGQFDQRDQITLSVKHTF